MCLVFNWFGIESSLENMTAQLTPLIEMLRIVPVQEMDARRQISLRRFCKQMVVVGHLDV